MTLDQPNPHGPPLPVYCSSCNARSVTYRGATPPRWRQVGEARLCVKCQRKPVRATAMVISEAA